MSLTREHSGNASTINSLQLLKSVLAIFIEVNGFYNRPKEPLEEQQAEGGESNSPQDALFHADLFVELNVLDNELDIVLPLWSDAHGAEDVTKSHAKLLNTLEDFVDIDVPDSGSESEGSHSVSCSDFITTTTLRTFC